MQKYDTMGLHEALSTVNVQCSDPLVLQWEVWEFLT